MRPVQYFSKEYLEYCRKLSPEQILSFLEDFKQLHAGKDSRTRLISMRVPEPLLRAFKAKAAAHGSRYQAQIKKLMKGWVDGRGT